jgi:hypothetical protein
MNLMVFSQGVAIFNPLQFLIKDCNDNFLEILGRTRDNLAEASMAKILPAVIANAIRRQAKNKTKQNKTEQKQKQNKTK